MDGVPQDLNFWKTLARVGRGAPPESLESVVHFLQPATFPHGGGSPPIHGAGFALTSFASPLQAVARLVRGTGGPDVLVLVGSSELAAEAKLQSFWGRGAGAVVEDLGCGEYVHGWRGMFLELCGKGATSE